MKVVNSEIIEGIQFVHLSTYGDDRGRFAEFFRKEWFPQRSWEVVQCNRSESVRGVLRGLHYHHAQVDYWHVITGTIRVGLVDLRASSPSYLASQRFDIAGSDLLGLYIPVGVAHGFYSLSNATLLYVVDSYYDGSDELGLAWNDPTVNVGWGISNPILSSRDRANPRLEDIPRDDLPA